MPDTVFLQILNMSLTASYVILFVVAARMFLKKAPKIFSYALWSVVLFRLTCPFSFSSKMSIFTLSGRTMEQLRPFSETFTTLSSALASQDAAATMGMDTGIMPMTPIAPIAPVLEGQPPLMGSVFTLLWLAGIGTLLVYSVVSLLRMKKRLKYAVHENANIYVSNNISSPFVMGLFRPGIYLPENLREEEKPYILLHEQTHIRRLDHVVRMISFFVLCLHWFNPFVWAAFFLSGRDMEMSCDEVVIKKLGNEVKKNYSLSLLALAANRRIVGGTPLAFGEGDTKSRIKNVLNYKKPAFCMAAVSLAAVAAIGFGLMATPRENSDGIYGSSAKDVLHKYSLALSASDITGIRQLMPAINPPAKDIVDMWDQLKISGVTLLHEDIRDNKAVFELSVTVDSAPSGLGIWTPGTA